MFLKKVISLFVLDELIPAKAADTWNDWPGHSWMRGVAMFGSTHSPGTNGGSDWKSKNVLLGQQLP